MLATVMDKMTIKAWRATPAGARAARPCVSSATPVTRHGSPGANLDWSVQNVDEYR
jgi:hypothetical protein